MAMVFHSSHGEGYKGKGVTTDGVIVQTMVESDDTSSDTKILQVDKAIRCSCR